MVIQDNTAKEENGALNTPSLESNDLKIVALRRNNENLHYPFLDLENGEVVKVATYYLIAKYPLKSNGIDRDVEGQTFNKQDYFNFCQERARIEVLPIIIKAMKEDKKYCKLSIQNKGYYEILKQYNLIKELKESLK